MISTPRKPRADAREEARAVGIEALGFLAADPKLLERFVRLTGIEPAEMRARATDPAFFAGLLDFVLADGRTLSLFAGASGVSEESVVAARRALGDDFATDPS